MSNKNYTNASDVNTNSPSERQNRKIYFQFGVFFDGTGNDMNNNHCKEQNTEESVRVSSCNNAYVQLDIRNAYKKEKNLLLDNESWNDDGIILAEKYSNNKEKDANDYSNVALLYKCYSLNKKTHPKISESEVHIFKIYVEGPGTTGSWWDKKWLGGGFGRGTGGVLSLLSKVSENIKIVLDGFGDISDAEFHFHVFGFSRGATLARMFSTMILDDNCPKKIISEDEKALRRIVQRSSTTVDFLGVFDTVSSIGFGTNDVDDYGLYLHDNVKNAMHLCAADEFREHFALTDFGDAVTRSGISEFIIPGCHTDVGGTYKPGVRQLKIQHLDYYTDYGGYFETFPYKMFTDSPCSKKGIVKNISLEVLKELGWFPESKSEKDIAKDNGFIYNITRRIEQGYNLLPFNLMLDRTKETTYMELFKSPPENISRFTIPPKVKELTSGIQKTICEKQHGRHVVFPGGNYNSKDYKELRMSYINYSAAPKDLVNKPSYNNDILCRQVVHGNKGSVDVDFMNNYNIPCVDIG